MNAVGNLHCQHERHKHVHISKQSAACWVQYVKQQYAHCTYSWQGGRLYIVPNQYSIRYSVIFLNVCLNYATLHISPYAPSNGVNHGVGPVLPWLSCCCSRCCTGSAPRCCSY